MSTVRGLHCMTTVGERLFVIGGNHFKGKFLFISKESTGVAASLPVLVHCSVTPSKLS